MISYSHVQRNVNSELARQVLEVNNELDRLVAQGEQVEFNIVRREGMATPLRPNADISAPVVYPKQVVEALAMICDEYQHQFTRLAEENREFTTDYQYAKVAGVANNIAVQIDMPALPREFLKMVEDNNIPPKVLAEVLKPRIFEIENSLACYSLMNGIFARDENGQSVASLDKASQPSYFEENFRSVLQEVSKRTSRKIALLAVTEEKYEAMKQAELGLNSGDEVDPIRVKQATAFDNFFGPKEFEEYLAVNNGVCDYVLYVRSSEPTSRLKKPGVEAPRSLLDDTETRSVIKENSITFNIDNPSVGVGGNRINDTKRYMTEMEMGLLLSGSLDSILDARYVDFCQNPNKNRSFAGPYFNEEFSIWLRERGCSEQDILEGKVQLRAKPADASYGCYGHANGLITDKDFRNVVRKGLSTRGSYIIQLEQPTLIQTDTATGNTYNTIHRVFLGLGRTEDGACTARLIGGFTSSMPRDTMEASAGRNHGNDRTVWSEIQGSGPVNTMNLKPLFDTVH